MRRSRHCLVTLVSALTCASAVALGGCGGSSATGGATAASAHADSATTQSALSGEVRVFAAASLEDAFVQLGDEFTAIHPDVTVTFDFQGSQDLVSALAEGSEADVLATANTSTMDKASAQGLVAAPTEFATNVLTLIVPAGNPAHVTGLDASLDGVDLVVCAPEVPCGEATVKLASELGVTLSPVSQEQKVTDVRGKVESGEADAGIVYTTDAADAGDKVDTIAVPSHSVINHYPIAVTTSATTPGPAQAFVDFILSAQGQRVLQDTYGFGAPSAS